MSRTTGERADEATGSVLLGAIWRSRWWVLVVVLVAAVGGYLYSRSQPEEYVATNTLVLRADEPFDALNTQSSGDSSRFVSDQVTVLRSTPVLERAAAVLGDIEAGELAKELTVVGSVQSNVIAVTATAESATAAAARANEVVAAYRQQVLEGVAQRSVAAQESTQDPQLTNEIRTRETAYGDGVEFFDPATAPSAPASPNPKRDAALVAGAAALLAIGLSLMRRRPASHSAWGLGVVGPRVLGTVPVRALRRGRPAIVDPSDHSHALVALDYARGGDTGAVLVTETRRAGGAAAVAHGLAVSAAAFGRKVLLIDADPESRELLLRLGSDAPSDGLETLGRQTSSVDQVVRAVQVGGSADITIHLATLGGDASGPLDGPRLHENLAQLATTFDLVLVQSGPVETDPLAFALVGQTAAVVAAADVKGGPEQLRGLTERLEVASRQLVGVVLTRSARTPALRIHIPKRVPAPQRPEETPAAKVDADVTPRS